MIIYRIRVPVKPTYPWQRLPDRNSPVHFSTPNNFQFYYNPAQTDFASAGFAGSEPEEDESVQFDIQQTYQQSYNDAIRRFAQALALNTPFDTDNPDTPQTLKLVDNACRFAGLATGSQQPQQYLGLTFI